MDIEEEGAQGGGEIIEVVLVHSRLQLDDHQVFVVLGEASQSNLYLKDISIPLVPILFFGF